MKLIKIRFGRQPFGKLRTSFFQIPMLLLIATGAHAQQPKSNAVPYWTNELARIAYIPETPGWYRFREGAVKNGDRFFVDYKKEMGLGARDDMKLAKTDRDEASRRHLRFQQYYNGVKIEGAEFIVHEKDGSVGSGNGKLVYGMAQSTTPSISEAAALQKALAAVPSGTYRVDAKTVVNRAAYQPKAELVFQKPNSNLLFAPDNFRLCFKFSVETNGGEEYAVYIDAANGSLVRKVSLVAYDDLLCNETPTVKMAHAYGYRKFTTSYNTGRQKYKLFDGCASDLKDAVWVLDAQGDTTLNNTLEYENSYNSLWGNSSYYRSPATTLWCTRRTINFYKTLFGRNGYNGLRGVVYAYQNVGWPFTDNNGVRRVGYQQASFSGKGIMRIGNSDGNANGNDNDDYNTLDIIGHEFTHGVTFTSSNLVYAGESGALNESFSDILGTYLEWWDNGTAFDWILGEDMGAPLRDMSNPDAYKHPDTYGGNNWQPTVDNGSNDWGGVHSNSGVQNYWFYLLSQGGSGQNDWGTSYSVTGVGIQTAAFLAYQTLVAYLSSDADYSDARAASTQAAIDYYGYCSNVAQQVAAAWNAVGVGNSVLFANNWGTTPTACGSYAAVGTFVHFYSATTLNLAQNCAVTLNPSAAPYSYGIGAVNTVRLYPGFSAKEGANVDIFIAKCANGSMPPYIAQRQVRELQVVKEEPEPAAPETSGLGVYPNPTSAVVQLRFSLLHDEPHAVLRIYNTLMQEVRQVALNTLAKGKQTARVDLTGLSPGPYVLELQLKSRKLSAKVVLLK